MKTLYFGTNMTIKTSTAFSGKRTVVTSQRALGGDSQMQSGRQIDRIHNGYQFK